MKLCQKLKKYFCYNKHFCLGQNAWKGHRKKIKINMSLNCVGGDGGVGDWQAAKFLGKQGPRPPRHIVNKGHVCTDQPMQEKQTEQNKNKI